MEKNHYHGVIIFSVALLATTTVLGSYLISKTGFSIQNVGTATTMDGKLTNTITVNGEGKVFANPDMVTINVGASELAKTTKEAMAQVNDKINKVLDILKSNNISSQDIQTSSLSLAPEYDWSSSTKIFRGQRASQQLTINIKKITPNSDKVTGLIDSITQINNIELNGITFDIEDKTDLYSQARMLAFQKAKQKATELAKLGEVELLKPVSITDTNVNYYPPMYSQNSFIAQRSLDSGSSQIPSGQLELSLNVDVVWGIK